VVVEESKFIDYYEVLEISPNANLGTTDRIFRYLAQRYHPGNPESGDRAYFDVVMEAYNTLKGPVKRAQYDIYYKEFYNQRRPHSSLDGITPDQAYFNPAAPPLGSLTPAEVPLIDAESCSDNRDHFRCPDRNLLRPGHFIEGPGRGRLGRYTSGATASGGSVSEDRASS
jgi:curved DNA-binding protein CbpA